MLFLKTILEFSNPECKVILSKDFKVRGCLKKSLRICGANLLKGLSVWILKLHKVMVWGWQAGGQLSALKSYEDVRECPECW